MTGGRAGARAARGRSGRDRTRDRVSGALFGWTSARRRRRLPRGRPRRPESRR